MENATLGLALDEIRKEIDTTLADGDAAGTQAEISLLRHLAHPRELRPMINRMISDETVLESIASRSYYHVNDFLKLVLTSGDEVPWRLRLHMWHPRDRNADIPQEDIHSHRWDFTTALLTGEYIAREYRIGPGAEYHHYRYLPVGEGQSFSLESLGKKQLFKAFEANLPAGTVYKIDHEVLHNISRSAGRPVASLLVQHQAVKDRTNVYRTSPLEGERTQSEVEVQRPSVPQLRGELQQLLTWLP